MEITDMVRQVREGNGELDHVLVQWASKIRLDGLVRRKTFHEHDAHDLKQEILLNISTRIDEFNPDIAQFETWAFNRTRQVIRSWIRKEISRNNPVIVKGYRERETIRGKLTTIEKVNEPILDITSDKEDFENFILDIKVAIDETPMAIDNVSGTKLTLDYLADGHTRSEIARLMNTTENKVGSNIRRLRKSIKFLESAYIS